MAQIVSTIASTVSNTIKGILLRVGFFNGGSNDEIISENTEMWSHYGFASRPNDADRDGCHEGFSVNLGGKNFVIADRDTRYQKVLGELQPGESAIYSAVDKGAASVVKCGKEMLFISLPTDIDSEGNVKKAHNVVLDSNSNSIIVNHGDGTTICLRKDNLVMSAGSNYIEIGPTGIVLSGNVKIVGATTGIGPIQGPTGPAKAI